MSCFITRHELINVEKPSDLYLKALFNCKPACYERVFFTQITLWEILLLGKKL